MRFADIIIAEKTFGRDFSAANVIAAFERHNAEVQRAIPPERLLVFEAAQGWEPLCRFLGVAAPDAPFPRTNSREEFWQHTVSPEMIALSSNGLGADWRVRPWFTVAGAHATTPVRP